MVRQILGRITRWLSPTALVLAGLCFLLPFVTVSCDIPGGYGRAAPGGTTTYTGVHLIVGAEPDVKPPEKRLPPTAGWDARLWPQPAAMVALGLIVAAIGVAIASKDMRGRRASVAVLAGVSATALLVNQALVEAEITVRAGEYLTQALPPGKSVRDYVHTGPGFVFGLLLLILVTVANGVGWLRARPRPALVAEEIP